MSFWITLILCYYFLFLMFVAYKDFKNNCFPLMPVLLHHPLAIFLAISLGFGFTEILFGYLPCFLALYIGQLIKGDEVVVGGLDILIMPLFTTLYGLNFLKYFLVVLAMRFIFEIKPLKVFIMKNNKNNKLVPLVPILFISMLITFNWLNF